MITKNIKMITNTMAFIVLVVFSFSCEEKDLYDTFDEFIPDNVVSVSSVRWFPLAAKEKVLLVVQISADPKVRKGIVTNLVGDVQFSFDIDRTIFQTEIRTIEFEAEEGIENLLVYLEDADGVRSVTSEVTISVLGEEHRSSLFNRELVSFTVVSPNEVTINFAPNTTQRLVNGIVQPVVIEPLLIETNFTYTDINGMEQTVVLDSLENEITITDIDTTFDYSYTTTYKAFEESLVNEFLDLTLSPDIFITDPNDGSFVD